MSVTDKEAVRLENVSYTADGQKILKQITGSFPEGKITTLVGPSGAGKTSLFRLMNGLRATTSGNIYVQEKPIEVYNPVELRRKVGVALQSATMISGSVFENLSLPLKLQGKELEQDDALELLDLVGLKRDSIQQNIKDLSGGQRQKLSIARTLVNRPDVLLLDEITASLDRVSQQDIEELIIRINQNYGTTIVWITHNLQQARSLGDYTWVMIEGEVVETGESSLLNNPSNEQVKRFVKGEDA
ncbi:ATP-binding cassette domain-containing protein [Sediminibacillus dalangtanensis]|uniref:ATP-binding cassette domain-containing protein n=1 Tax=Sediminibacillus dalangtanensis TaxID=2729421 RepID=A0ABX7VQ77_9BACI|nr:phosphate ABC transporter ATP-binding protein [Sediminibacillus dalangtanensis]QTM99097.1 ATP-binding cassette domain-containing protein [Sediminibacillus dalangtanensis]